MSLGLHPCGSVGQKVKTRRGKRHLCSICWQWQRAVIVNGPFYVSFSRRASTKTKIVFRAARVALLSSKTYFKTSNQSVCLPFVNGQFLRGRFCQLFTKRWRELRSPLLWEPVWASPRNASTAGSTLTDSRLRNFNHPSNTAARDTHVQARTQTFLRHFLRQTSAVQ